MNTYQKNKYRNFVWILLSFNIIFWLSAIITRGDSISLYFLSDSKDTYMDYFNMLSNIEGLDPYYANANYPALAFVIWRLFYRIVPWNESNTVGYFLRETQAAQLGFILFMLFCIIMIWELSKLYSEDKGIYKLLFPVCIITSGPVLFTIERGNIIILSFIFSFIFLLLYDSEKKELRYFAYLCLSIAAGIKIYPAVLGILVLSKRRYKESILLIGMGIIIFIVPFFAFDGLDSFLTMIKGIFISSSDTLSWGYGYNFSFNNLIRMIQGLMGNYVEGTHPTFLLIPAFISALVYILNKETWKKVFALVIFMIWIPGFSYTYVLIFMILPLVLFLKAPNSSFDFLYTIFFVCIMGIWCLPKIEYINYLNGDEFRWYLTYGMLIVNLIIVLFSVLLIYDGIKNRIQIGRKHITDKHELVSKVHE